MLSRGGGEERRKGLEEGEGAGVRTGERGWREQGGRGKRGGGEGLTTDLAHSKRMSYHKVMEVVTHTLSS